MKHLVIAALAFGFVLASAPAPAAEDMSPADEKALHDYTLSMDKVKALQAAMAEAEKAGPAVADSAKNIGNDSKDFAEMKAKLQADAPFFAIFTKHGLTADDAVLMPYVLMSAGIAAQYPDAAPKLASQTSPEQIAFVKAHQVELDALHLGSK